MSPSKARRLIVEAADAQAIVRIERSPKYADRLVGLVVEVGSKWALMARIVDGGYFDGFVAFRVKDVKRITADGSVAAAFAKISPEWPPSYSAPLDLDSTVGVLEGLGHGGHLLGIQKEMERKALWIGTLDEIRGRFVYLHEVRHDGMWHPEPLGYRVKAITSIEVGLRYFSALTAVAGAGPENDQD